LLKNLQNTTGDYFFLPHSVYNNECSPTTGTLFFNDTNHMAEFKTLGGLHVLLGFFNYFHFFIQQQKRIQKEAMPQLKIILQW